MRDAPDPRILHLWGSASGGPESDADAIAAFAAAHSGGGPAVVVTPSYWGGRRRELLAAELLRRGFDPRITDIATELMGAEPPTADASVLVEVEAGRVCVSVLDFDSGLAESRITHRCGDATAIIEETAAQLIPEPGDEDTVEYIVADDERLVADMRRRGWLAFPVPIRDLGAHVLPPAQKPSEEVRPVADEVRRDAVGDDAATTSRAGASEGRVDVDIAGLRRRAREMADVRGGPPHRGLAALTGAVALVIAVIAVVVIVDGPVGRLWRDHANGSGFSAQGADQIADGAIDGAVDEMVDGVAPAGVTGHADRAGERPSPPSTPGRSGSGGSEVLEGHGLRAVMPDGWTVDDTAGADALVLVDGGPMRVLISAGPVDPGLGTEGLAAGLAAHAEANPTMDRVRAEVIEDLDVVVVEERPGDGSVVLWQHRIAGAWQVSVGCQFRGATIPQVRPVCGRALRTAEVIGR